VRWLLLKDLQILRRSPLILALLVAYPVALGLLIGFALSDDDGKPRVAFLNLVPPDESFDLGAGEEDFGSDQAREELCKRVECVDADSREEAEEMVSDGDVIAALVLPPDLLDKLRTLSGLDPEQPTVEVLVNEDDPVKAQLVDDRISALITEANLILSERVSQQAAEYLDLLVAGGSFEIPFLGQTVDILGLERSEQILKGIRESLPQGSGERELVDQVTRFARLAGENLDFALPLLGAVAQPIEVSKLVLSGDTPSLDSFAIAVAATVTLMFVTVLLVAGSLALEREENAFTRITRGPVGTNGLLVEKIGLGIVASLAVTLLMLGALSVIETIDWARAPAILAAIVCGGAAFAAFGAAIGGAAREVRASSLLAFMVSLPIAFLSLVPSGTVSATAFDLLQILRALFPFDPSLDAMQSGLDEAGPDLLVPLLHLLAIVAAYGLLARLALRRFVT
jgi:ABC-type multidrug transport system permease subunit